MITKPLQKVQPINPVQDVVSKLVHPISMISFYNCWTYCLHEKEPVKFWTQNELECYNNINCGCSPYKKEIMKILPKYRSRFCENESTCCCFHETLIECVSKTRKDPKS